MSAATYLTLRAALFWPIPPVSQHFNDIGQAKGSKLVRRLLKIDAIQSVFLGRDFVSINKKEGAGWAVRMRGRG